MFLSEDWKLVHQTLSANRAGMMLDMCERLVPPRAVDALTSMHEHKIIRYSRRFSRLVQVECNKLSPSLSPRNEKQTNKRCLRPGLSHA